MRSIIFLILLGFSSLCSQEIDLHRPIPNAFSVGSAADGFKPRAVEISSDLQSWGLIHAETSGQLQWTHPPAGNLKFLRLSEPAPVAVAPDPIWSSTLSMTNFVFKRGSGGCSFTRWSKFTIVPGNIPQVYFQNVASLPFHYDFARNHLPPFAGMSQTDYEAVSLHATNQQAYVGSVLINPSLQEYAIQIGGLDPIARETVAFLYETVDNALIHKTGYEGFYLPVYEQAIPTTDESWLSSQGVRILSPTAWCAGANQCYSDGWAIGRLMFSPSADIGANYAAGILKPTDILLTDAIPSSLPYFAGIITLEPSSPNSHVAILAQSYNIPFGFVSGTAQSATLMALTGQEVSIKFGGADCAFDVVSLDGLPDSLLDPLRALGDAPPLTIPPKQAWGGYWANTDALGLADVRSFGGKAANYALLRDTIPMQTPPAIAFSFDLWDDFMNQLMANNLTLRQNIQAKLAPYSTYPVPNLTTLYADLDEIQGWIRDDADFTGAQSSQIATALGTFDTTKKIRFRSSTNVEDTDRFSGAGLYRSYSGCLLDDFDADPFGPSRCDPTKPEERGVFRAIKRVYSSFYRDNAFLERLRHGVNESQVAMGVLAHSSYPDAGELANGVATMDYNSLTGNKPVLMVSQVGPTPVTETGTGAVPEIRRVTSFSSSSMGGAVRQASSLLTLGQSAVFPFSENLIFLNAFEAVAIEYGNRTGKTEYTLDFEYKKMAPDTYIIKQVREVPRNLLPAAPTLLVSEPACYQVTEGENPGNLMALHRLKGDWMLDLVPQLLNTNAPFVSIHTAPTATVVNGNGVQSLTSNPALWPSHSNAQMRSPSADFTWWNDDTFQVGPTTYTLETSIPSRDLRVSDTGRRSLCPVVRMQDMAVEMRGTYATPQPTLQYAEGDGFTYGTPVTSEVVHMTRCPDNLTNLPPGADRTYPEPFAFNTTTERSGIIPQTRTFTMNGVGVDIRFDWNGEYQDFQGSRNNLGLGYATFHLARWGTSTFTGITSQPLVLSSRWAQTYRPAHHNRQEGFLFEPARDPSVSAATLAELTAANIRYILVGYHWSLLPSGREGKHVQAMGFDGVIRDLP